MEKITEGDFYLLLKRDGKIQFKIINLTYVDLKELSSIIFIDCVFINNLKIVDSDVLKKPEEKSKSISFNRCILKSIDFLSCNFTIFEIINIKLTNGFSIQSCQIDTFRFLDCENINCEINIRLNNFFDVFTFENNHFSENGDIKFFKNTFFKECLIEKNSFNFIGFVYTNFKEFTAFVNNKFINIHLECPFFICEFEQVDFSNNDIRILKYINCKFLGTTLFKDIPYHKSSSLSFELCTFHKYLQLNKSSFYNLSLENNKFLEIVSFQETYLDLISIDKSVFEKGAYFDDIQIKKIDDCNRRTIRTIKQELQKAENKIDFSRFRVYEFNAYRKDIRKKLAEFKKDKNSFYHRKREPIQLKRDLFILDVSDIISEYGTDWKRAGKFTLITGLAAFSLFYILENIDKTFNLENWDDFLYGYFRFFLITDFKNEYYEAGESVLKFNFFLSLIPFIIGKIAVAFGLYEMIQSFRKFKA